MDIKSGGVESQVLLLRKRGLAQSAYKVHFIARIMEQDDLSWEAKKRREQEIIRT